MGQIDPKIISEAAKRFYADVKNGLYDKGEPLHIYKEFKFELLPTNISNAYIQEVIAINGY